MNSKLKGCRILLARPELAAKDLMQQIAKQGGVSTCMPLFAIKSLLTPALMQQLKDQLKVNKVGIFISRNAAEIALPLIDFTDKIQWACMGPVTEQYLRQAGLKHVLCPSALPYDSTSLIKQFAQSKIILANNRVLIITGKDGDNWLADALESYGAIVETVAVYERIMPQVDLAEFEQLFGIPSKIDIILITCVTSLENLHNLSQQTGIDILEVPLMVVSERIRKRALEMGHKNVYNSGNMSDQDIMRALSEWNALNV